MQGANDTRPLMSGRATGLAGLAGTVLVVAWTVGPLLFESNATPAYKASWWWPLGKVFHYRLRCAGESAWRGAQAVNAVDLVDARRFLADRHPGCEIQHVPRREALRGG